MPLDLLAQVADRYERQARLYPSLLAAAPLFAIAIGLYGIPLEPKAGLLTLLASFGVIYVLATFSRELGKRLEDKLFLAWGGKPTTQLLRHRSSILDPVTKARYHAFLSKKLDIPFPNASQEQADQIGRAHV